MISMEIIRNVITEMKKKYMEEAEEGRKALELELKKKFPGHLVYVFRVHELVECPLKRKYRERFPDYAFTVFSKPKVVIGEMIDIASKVVSGLKYDYVAQRAVKVADRMVVGIIGNINIYDEERGEVIEVKFTDRLDKTPRVHHIEQVRLYLWLTKGFRGKLLYISPDGWREYFVSGTPDTEEVADYVYKLVNGMVPAPKWKWECKYCPFKEVCEKWSTG